MVWVLLFVVSVVVVSSEAKKVAGDELAGYNKSAFL
jgi:hypothetical protein